MPYKDSKHEPRVGDKVLGDAVKGHVAGFSDPACAACALPYQQHVEGKPKKDGPCGAFALKPGALVVVRGKGVWNAETMKSAQLETPADPATLVLHSRASVKKEAIRVA